MEGHRRGQVSGYLENLQLETLDDAIDTYRRIIRGFADGHAVSDGDARTLGYLLKGFLEFLKHKDDLRIEERIEALEERLQQERKQ